MANVVRFTLPVARNLNLPGIGYFVAGVLDINADNYALVSKARYRVRPYGAVEVGVVAAGTPAPSLPALPSPPDPDPFPQYLTEADLANPTSGPSVALRAALGRPASLAKVFARASARRVTPFRMAGVGSSTMQGVGATTAADRFFDQLVARMQRAFPSGGAEPGVVASTSATWGTLSTAPGVHGYNAGSGGTTSASFLTDTTTQRIAALDPGLIVYVIGPNDYADGIAPATYKANVQSRIDALKTSIPNPAVHLLVHTFQRMDLSGPAYPWSAYGDALRQIAAADPNNVVFLDLTADYAQVGIPIGLPRTLAAGAVISSDSLKRTATSLGQVEVGGQAWQPDGTWSLTASGASCTAGSGLAYLDVGTGDMDVSDTATITSGSGAIGLMINAQDGSNRIVFYLTGGAWTLGKFDASGSVVTLATGAANTTGPVTHTMRATSIGETITLYLDGAQVGSYTLTSAEQAKFKAFTKAGLRHNPAVVGTLSDFSVKTTAQSTVTVVDPLNLIGGDNLHQTDGGHAFMSTEVARGLGVLAA